jgi:glycogen phosphorylase
MSSAASSDRPSATAVSDALTELALDLRWSFNHSADQLWERIDPELWELTHNAWVVLQTVSRERLHSVTSDPNFQKLLAELHGKIRTFEESEGWFQTAHPGSGISPWNLC